LAQLQTLNLDFNRITTLRPFLQPDVAFVAAFEYPKPQAAQYLLVSSFAMKNLSHLSLRSNNLTLLLGLEVLVALVELDLARNSVSTFDELIRFGQRAVCFYCLFYCCCLGFFDTSLKVVCV
jgi:Leucine-rich repeat (LRR) protein